jgi:hypothetical protein
VTNIMRGNGHYKLKDDQSTAQRGGAALSEAKSSGSSSSRDPLTIVTAQAVVVHAGDDNNDDANNDNDNCRRHQLHDYTTTRADERYLVTSDLASAWVQMGTTAMANNKNVIRHHDPDHFGGKHEPNVTRHQHPEKTDVRPATWVTTFIRGERGGTGSACACSNEYMPSDTGMPSEEGLQDFPTNSSDLEVVFGNNGVPATRHQNSTTTTIPFVLPVPCSPLLDTHSYPQSYLPASASCSTAPLPASNRTLATSTSTADHYDYPCLDSSSSHSSTRSTDGTRHLKHHPSATVTNEQSTRTPTQSTTTKVPKTMAPGPEPSCASDTSMSTSMTMNASTANSTKTVKKAVCLWRAAVDPKSSRTYYYHTKTRETQWSMPMEMATDEEKAAMQEKEQGQRDFFAMMEANILKSMATGVFTQKEVDVDPRDIVLTEPLPWERDIVLSLSPGKKSKPKLNLELSPHSMGKNALLDTGIIEQLPVTQQPMRANLVRTISTMDQSVLRALVQRVPSYRNVPDDGDGDDDHTDEHDISFSPNDVTHVQAAAVGLGRNTTNTSNNEKCGNELLSIQEALQASWSQSLSLGDSKGSLSLGDSGGSLSLSLGSESKSESKSTSNGNDTGKRPDPREIWYSGQDKPRRNSSMKLSVDSLLAGLPDDDYDHGGVPKQRSFYGASMLEENFNYKELTFTDLGLSEEEFAAMENLAALSDKMKSVKDSEDDLLIALVEGDEDDEDESSQTSSLGSESERGFMEMPGGLMESAVGDNSRSSIMSMPSLTSCGATPAAVRPTMATKFNANATMMDLPDSLTETGGVGESSRSSILSMPSLASCGATPAATRPTMATTSTDTATDTATTTATSTPTESSSMRSLSYSDTSVGETPVSVAVTVAVTVAVRPTTERPKSQRKLKSSTSVKRMEKPEFKRRNTCSTLYVGSTMSAPDKDATIKVRYAMLCLFHDP